MGVGQRVGQALAAETDKRKTECLAGLVEGGTRGPGTRVHGEKRKVDKAGLAVERSVELLLLNRAAQIQASTDARCFALVHRVAFTLAHFRFDPRFLSEAGARAHEGRFCGPFVAAEQLLLQVFAISGRLRQLAVTDARVRLFAAAGAQCRVAPVVAKCRRRGVFVVATHEREGGDERRSK